MNNFKKLKATLDACVLYPAPVRDLLLHLAEVGIYFPFWTTEINNEWVRNLLINRPDIKPKSLTLTVNAMNTAFPYANTIHYETLINSILLPDKNDRHVVAAAIKSNSTIIITQNIKDFPILYLKAFGIDVQTPDSFISTQINLHNTLVLKAFINQVKNLKHPPQTPIQVLSTLEKNGLNKSVQKLRRALKGLLPPKD